MIEYRYAKSQDFEEVLSIENECFLEPYSRADLKYEFEENPVNKIIVAEKDGKVIGFIDYLITFNSATIMQIAVAKQYRNLGIATHLLSEMEKSFPKEVDELVESVTLEVRVSNKPAVNLYTKNGYKIVVVKSHYYKDGENAIYMIKRL